MKTIAYLGFSAPMVEILAGLPDYRLAACFCDAVRASPALEAACTENGVPFRPINNDSDIAPLLCGLPQPDFFIIYKTGIIIHAPLLPQYAFYNFHTGNLATNRGAHPLVWNLLLGETEATITLHQISDTIDSGNIIEICTTLILPEDTTATLERRLESFIPIMLDGLSAVLAGAKQTTPAGEGVYRRKITPQDYTLIPGEDSFVAMQRKIRSQLAYSGAILQYDGKEHYCFAVQVVVPTDENTGVWLLVQTENGDKFYFLTQRPRS